MTPRRVAGLVLAGAFALAVFFLAPPQIAQAYDCTTLNSGDWNDKSIWDSCNGWYPGTNDTATINAGHRVTLNLWERASGLSVSGTLDLASDYTLEINNGSVTVNGTVSGSGTFFTTGTTSFASAGSANFSAAWEVYSGATTAYGRVDGPVTVDGGAELRVQGGSYLFLYGDVSVASSGTLSGDSGSVLEYHGGSFTNDGMVTAPYVYWQGTGTQTIHGSGTWSGGAEFHISTGATVELANDVSLAYPTYANHGTLALGSSVLTVAGGSVDNHGTVSSSSGAFRTTDTASMYSSTANFTAAWEVAGGTTIASGGFHGPVTVTGGATLSVSSSLSLYGSVTVEGTLEGSGVTLDVYGPDFNNTGSVTVSSVIWRRSGTTVLSGTGAWSGTSSFVIYSGTTVSLDGNVSIAYTSLTNYGTLSGGSDVSQLEFGGATLTNNGTVSAPRVSFHAGSTAITGSGAWTGTGRFIVTIGSTVVLGNDISMAYGSYEVFDGATLDLQDHTLTFAPSGSLTFNNAGTLNLGSQPLSFGAAGGAAFNSNVVNGTGEFRTWGTVTLGTTYFYPTLHVQSGVTTANGTLDGPVVVDAGATLRAPTSWGLAIHGNLTVNGTLSGETGASLSFSGATFTNNGTVSVPHVDFSGGPTTIAGAGTWSGDVFHVMGSINVALANGITLTYNTTTIEGTLALGGNALAVAGGSVYVDPTAAVTSTGAGHFSTTGVTSFLSTGGDFTAAWEVTSGTTYAQGTVHGPVTVAAGATLTAPTSGGGLALLGSVTVNGDLSGDDAASHVIFGAGVTNNGVISVANVWWRLPSAHTIAGAGSWTGTGSFYMEITTAVTLATDLQLSFSTYMVSAGATLNLAGYMLDFMPLGSLTFTNDGTVTLGSGLFDFGASGGATFNGAGGTVNGAGLFQTSGAVTLIPGTFSAPLYVGSGVTTACGTLGGTVDVDVDTELQVQAGCTLTVNGSMGMQSLLTGGDSLSTLAFAGSILNNSGAISVANVTFNGGAPAIWGGGSWTGSAFRVNTGVTVAPANNITLAYSTTTIEGTLALGGHILTVSGGSFTNNGTVSGAGTFRTTGSTDFYGATNTFTAAFQVYGGVTTAAGTLSGPVSIDGGATLRVAAGSTLILQGDLTVNGLLRDADTGSLLDFEGPTFTLNAQAWLTNVTFSRAGTTTLTCSGSWTGTGAFTIGSETTVALGYDMSLPYGAITNDGVLDLQTYTLALTASPLTFTNRGTLNLGTRPFAFGHAGGTATFSGGTVNGEGEFRTAGAVTLRPGVFNAPLHVVSNTTTASYGGIHAPVTVDGGATLWVPDGSPLSLYDDLTNWGTLSGGSGASLYFGGWAATLVNDTLISVPSITFANYSQTLRGYGQFSNNIATIVDSDLTLGSDHRMSAVAAQGDFGHLDIGGHTLTLTGAGTALTVSTVGGLNTDYSTIVYAGAAAQQVATTNVAYNNLTINNAAGAVAGELAVTGLLNVQQGALSGEGAFGGVQIAAAGALSLIGDCTVAGDFTNSGTLTANGHRVTFDGYTDQNLTANVATAFAGLTVGEAATLVETAAADNVTVSSLTNLGVIRKEQAIAGTGPVSFGLTGVQMNVATQGGLTSLTVDRVDANHANATVGVQTGRYWTLTPNGGAAGYNVDLSLSHNALADPTVCRYTGADWNCARNDFASTWVRRNGVTTLSAWAVGRDIASAAAPTVTIGKSGSNVNLSWTNIPADAGGYIAWTGASPYFAPGPPATSVTRPAGSTGWTHTGGAGNPLFNWYYVVQGVNGAGNISGPSNRTGTFSFSLTPGTR